MNLMIDAHSHLDHHLIAKNAEEIVQRAKAAGLKYIVSNGINPETNRKCLELSEKYPMIKCAMGLYPKSALKKETESGEYPMGFGDFDTDGEISFIRKHKNKIVAISEVGLDFVGGEVKEQIEDFEKMIKLAKELNKPVVVHSRKAEQKAIEVLEGFNYKKVVMHCFCGKKSLIKRASDNNWFFTVPTVVVRSHQFQDLVKNVGISQLFCETDSPYLSPYKEKMNEPAFVIESYKKIAEIKNMEMIEVVNNIYMNWQRVFE